MTSGVRLACSRPQVATTGGADGAGGAAEAAAGGGGASEGAAAVEPVVTGALEVVGAAVVDVVCSAVPHAVSTPPRPAPRPTVAVTKPAACRNSRRLRVSSSLIRSWLLMMI